MSRNALFFAAMCFVWGLTWLPVKIGSAHVPPVFLAASRFLIAGALMLMLAGRPAFHVPKALWSRVFWTGIAVNTGNYAFLFWGIAHAPTGLAAIVNFAMIPIVTIIAGRLLGDEVIDRRKLAAIALGVLGLALLFASRITGPDLANRDPLELAGLVAIALGTISYCCGAVLTRPFSAQLPTMVLAGWQTLIG
ncbi:MAG: DMT family transporter, partial [Bosea sp. (in: a-proteobacteria)]